jgi:hypothetical protein
MPVSRNYRRNTQKRFNCDQDQIPDDALPSNLCADREALPPPMSLRLDENVMLGCVLGDLKCCAIRDSWRPSLPIAILAHTESDNPANENSMVFASSLANLAEGD